MYARTRSKVSASAKVSTVAAVVSPVNAVKADQSPAEETSARTRRFARPLGHKALQSPAVETRELPTVTVAAAVEEAHVTPLQSHIMHIRGSRSVDKNDVTSEAKPPSTASLKSTRQAARSKPKYTFRARLNATSSSLDSTFDDDEGRENILGSPGATPAKRGRKRLALESDISSLADTSVVNGLQSHLLGTESNETASSSIAQMSGQSTPAVEVDNKRTQADRAVKPFTDCTVSLQDQLLLAEIGAAKETAMAMAQKRLKITMAMEQKRLKTELECEKLKLEIAALKKLAATKK